MLGETYWLGLGRFKKGSSYLYALHIFFEKSDVTLAIIAKI